jgi:hypothetical protein
LASIMRLSLKKDAHAALSNAAWQEIRVRSGRDDKFVAERDSVFPGNVRGTADPSAALGMTKRRATLPWESGRWTKSFFIPWRGPQAHDSSGRSEVERSAVLLSGRLMRINAVAPRAGSRSFLPRTTQVWPARGRQHAPVLPASQPRQAIRFHVPPAEPKSRAGSRHGRWRSG